MAGRACAPLRRVMHVGSTALQFHHQLADLAFQLMDLLDTGGMDLRLVWRMYDPLLQVVSMQPLVNEVVGKTVTLLRFTSANLAGADLSAHLLLEGRSVSSVNRSLAHLPHPSAARNLAYSSATALAQAVNSTPIVTLVSVNLRENMEDFRKS